MPKIICPKCKKLGKKIMMVYNGYTGTYTCLSCGYTKKSNPMVDYKDDNLQS